jgi:lipopolysaccharide biosynthesis glycosyltransferase
MSDPQRNDCAVAFCCDRNYFPFALFTIWQIAHFNPRRRFDFVVSSRDALEVPQWAKSLGIVTHQAGAMEDAADVARHLGSAAPLYRIMLARELQDRYRRILYLDCDLFVEGGDINRLLEIDIGPHPIAAVLDAPLFKYHGHRAKEYRAIGLSARPYANTGVQLIDTRAYVEQEVERRSFEVCRTHPEAIIYSDQSLTNIALRGKFAQLAPCWNWQFNDRLPLAAFSYPVFLRHFIGRVKPDRYSGPKLDARFNQAYRGFIDTHMPELLPKIAPLPDPSPLRLRDIAKIGLEHLATTEVLAAALARHPDPYVAVY